jgi:hypothetical protein
MNIVSTDASVLVCGVLVYIGNTVLLQQCNHYHETSTIHTLETFPTMQDMQARVDELGLQYPADWGDD